MDRHLRPDLHRAAGLIAALALLIAGALTACRPPDAPAYAEAVGSAVAAPPGRASSPPADGPGTTPMNPSPLVGEGQGRGGVVPRPPLPVADLIPERAIDLIIAFEVGSPEVYHAKYRRPIWPGAASGVTVGIGYDLGHAAPRVIALDWESHPHAVRLSTASGTTGPLARELAKRLADVVIEYGHARQVFDQTSVVEHYRIARRVFGGPAFDALPPNAQGALVSVVFNRGGAMAGERRREMRAIRDACVPAADTACIATQLRAMTRLWAGTDIEAGMRRRRHAEAELATT
jgi:hypothetical protein